MKKRFTLVLTSLIVCLCAMATPPVVSASNLSFTSNLLDGGRFGFTFRKGDGAYRLIVVKEGSPITTEPVNDVSYPAGSTVFGTPGTEFNGDDGFVIFCGSHAVSNPSTIVTNLKYGTTYYMSIWEFNGSGTATEFLLIPLTGQITTKSAPTQQATISSFSNVTGNRMQVSWTGGNGEKTLLLARKGAPVNATPEQLHDYTANAAFGDGSAINGDNYVVYEGSGSSVTVTNLEPNTEYYFAIFEFNGNVGPVYLLPGNTGQRKTNAGPTQASGTISFNSVEGNRLSISYSAGNGKHQLIIARKEQPVTAVPVNGESYVGNPAYGQGHQFPNGDFVLNSTGSNRTFTNLEIATTYYFRIYDFDVDAEGNTYYLTSSYSEKAGATAGVPASDPSGFRLESISGTSFSFKYEPGESNYRLIVIRANDPVDAVPVNLTRYSGNPNFGSGTQITPGNYVLYGQTNSNAGGVTGLTPGVTYHLSIWGFNGKDYPVYGSPYSVSVTMPNEPSTPGNSFSTNTHEGNSFRLSWSGGDGSHRLVIAKKGSPVTATPTDGVEYAANNRFAQGYMIAQDEYVVYSGPGRSVAVENLEPATTYHFAVYEYNLAGNLPDYLVTQKLVGAGSTVSTPTQGTGGLSASEIQDNQAKINFSAGNGSGRLFIMRAGSPVDAEPEDLVSYSAHTTYGNREIGNGNFIVQKSNNSIAFTVNGLSPNTHYYVTAFEYNGTNAPLYLRPGVSFDFTTTGSGVQPPAAHSTAPSFDIVDGNQLKFSWQKGDGARRIVVMKAGSAVTFTPTDGVDYDANNAFGAGPDLGDGQYVVYDGNNETVTVTNLQPATTYHFAVFEYNGTGTQTKYLVSGHLQVEQSTATVPASGSSNVSGTVNGLTLALSWTSGAGAGRLVVLKEGSAVAGTPANLSVYAHSTTFKNGTQIAAGEYVVYNGSGASVNVSGLEAGKTYHYAIFEYNGVDAPIYNTTNVATGNVSVAGSLPLKWLSFTAKELDGKVLLSWATTEEVHTSHFEVERSVNGADFAVIGTLAAKGGAVRNDYSFEDADLQPGTLVYRIQQVDVDNRFAYSKMVSVHIRDRKSDVQLAPNPASGTTKITLPQGVQQATVQVYNISGVLVKTIKVSSQQTIALHDLKKGAYHIVVAAGAHQWSKQLIVQ